MSRFRLLLPVLLGASLLAPGAASAAIYQLGHAKDDPQPSCPPINSCRVVTRSTVYQARSNLVKSPMMVPRAGRVVAFSLRIGDMQKKNIHFFNTNYGGTPRVALTVLRKVKLKKGSKAKPSYGVVKESAIYHIQPFFGTTVSFALQHSVIVRKGDIIGLTVPTWAPILGVGLGTTDQWRTSQAAGHCNDLTTETALKTGDASRFGCQFTTQRLTYQATIVGAPKPKYDKNQNPIKKKK